MQVETGPGLKRPFRTGLIPILVGQRIDLSFFVRRRQIARADDDFAGDRVVVDTSENRLFVGVVSPEGAEPPMQLPANGRRADFRTVFIGTPAEQRGDEIEAVGFHGRLTPCAFAAA